MCLSAETGATYTGRKIEKLGLRGRVGLPRLASADWLEGRGEPGRANAVRVMFPNARAETVDRLPTFCDSFRAKRCLMPATGFYEWTAEGKKRPHHLRMKGGSPFAALWSAWGTGREKVVSC